MFNYVNILKKIFWKKLSEDFFNLLKNFNISFWWLIIVNFITFVINIYVARLLWVEDFWKINLILSSTLSVFALFLFDYIF